MREQIAVSEPFAELTGPQLRLVEEASQLGDVTLHLWPDDLIPPTTSTAVRFPAQEREYWWGNCRFVSAVAKAASATSLLTTNALPAVWVMPADTAYLDERLAWCQQHGVRPVLIDAERLRRFPEPPACPSEPATGRRRVIVTGTFDWFHTGHVRFLEEAASYGDLYVCVGHDANIRMLKGPDRPLYPQNERAYIASAFRFPKLALVTTGAGWLDAAPEIARLKPHVYLVNEDGDVPEKRAFCAENNLEYVVLKRTPKEGLPQRSSTTLRSMAQPPRP